MLSSDSVELFGRYADSISLLPSLLATSSRNSCEFMVVAESLGDWIGTICDDVAAKMDGVAVNKSSSISVSSGSSRSCTPSLSTKKLNSPTVISKPDSSRAKAC